VKKTWDCPGGGFVQLQQRLIEQKEIKCQMCCMVLAQLKFDASDLERAVQSQMTALVAGEKSAGQDGTGAEKQDEEQDEKQDEKEADQAEVPLPLDPFAYAKSLHPIIELLTPGTSGKKYPYRCTVCTTRRQPQGKIGELAAAKPATIRHFLERHLDSVSHRHALQRHKEKIEAEKADHVDCQGFLV